MGVTGLWRLIEPAGKPVPVETLENKVLAVDISIWLHQMVKGYQDAKGAPVANAHLMGLFQRLCKLLYFRIKPVFVFDGAFPELKRQTIAKRQDNKAKYNSESERLKRELALLLTKKTAISGLLGKQISPKGNAGPAQNDDDIFKLPALPARVETESESEEEENSSSSTVDIHSIDVESENFKTLPAKEKFDLLIELKETRKMNSWGRLHELPKKSDSFSDFQMQRLLKRRKIQECLEETEKEMGDGGMSITELESILNEEGIDTKIESLPTKRIAANNTTRYLLINNVKQALEEAKRKKEEEEAGPSKTVNVDIQDQSKKPKTDELEEDLEKAIKMSLECVEGDTSVCTTKTDDSWTSYYSDFEYSSESEGNDATELPDMSSAKAYIMQNTDFTSKAIDKLVSHKEKVKNNNKPIIHEIIAEINYEKSVIIDKLDISSDEDEQIKSVGNKDEVSCSKLEINTTSGPMLNNDVNVTQSSVVFVDNQVPDIIELDCSSQDSPQKPNSPKEEITSSKADISDSDSSDNDFEDVPDVEQSSKTIVQLTLNNVNDTLEDDIFADVFENKDFSNKTNPPIKAEISNLDNEKVDNSEVNKSIVLIDEEDDELQKAIQMSLECVSKENSEVKSTEMEIIQNEIHSVSSSKEDTTVPNKRNISSAGPSVKETETQEVTNHENIQTQIATTSKESNPQKETITVEKLNDMVEEINTEEQELIQEKGRLDRVGRNITEQMTKDAQELLQLFGIPYIIAPMEAEAQCAFLESVGLTDGTITDDSDIWLFGGKTVYKNFFNQKKHVLQFLSDRIEKSFNLSREQLILLALLVGSDYTVGLTGVGPVTALEILASFPFSKKKLSNETSKQDEYAQLIAGLQEFKQWVRSGKRTDNTNLKKKLRNVSVTDDFPSVRVVQAYLEPNVERSEDRFTWGEIDVNVLRNYTKAKFGWSQNKLDEIIKPVLKRLTERKSQKSVHEYFKRKTDFQSLEEQMSKRVKAAVQKMGPESALEDTSANPEDKSKPERKRKPNKTKAKNITEAGPSKAKQTKTEDKVLTDHSVRVVSEIKDGKSAIDIKIRKTDRYQEIIPQREKDKQNLLQNKMKAIEVFRKTTIDKKKKLTKRKVLVPKADADLSESSDSN